MSYEPTNWQKGDIITAEKLNKLENGVVSAGGGGSGVFEIFFEVYWDEDANADVVTCDKTLDEISAAKTAGQYITARALIWQTGPSKAPIGFDVDPEYNWYEFAFEWIDNDPSWNYMYSGKIEYDTSTQKWKWVYSQYTVTPYTPSP